MRWSLGGICAFLLLFTISSIPTARAQSPDPVKFIFSPQVPGPNELVRIEAQGIGSFLGDATITWRLNGKVVLTGAGERVYSFTTGGLGEQSRVDITIVSSARGTITKSFSFIPTTVNLVWEADTTVPPFFMGKALYSAGSQLTVTAFPTVIANGRTITSNNFSFQWSRNGNKVPNQSGMGRGSFTFNGDQLLARENVQVDVYFDNVLVARGSTVIPTTKPVLALYYRDSLRGTVYDLALAESFRLGSAETTLQAQPYFFANSSAANKTLDFSWKINTQAASGPETAEGIITLRQVGTGAGESRVAIKLQNLDPDKFIQSAETFTRLFFGGQSNSAFPSPFGL